MGSKTFYINEFASFTDGLDGQTAEIRINAQVDARTFDTIPHTFVTVSLAGTSVKASKTGEMASTRDGKRGWYNERTDVRIKIDNADFIIEEDAPPTAMGGAATTSSTALSVNVGAGTFGPTPTTNVGAGATIGSSFSRNLTDFRVENNSGNTEVFHQYFLAASSGGGYGSPESLMDMSVGGQLQGAPLFDLPEIAISNLPILSQVIFRSRTPQKQDAKVTITVTERLVWCEKTFKFFVADFGSKSNEVSHTCTFDVALSSL